MSFQNLFFKPEAGTAANVGVDAAGHTPETPQAARPRRVLPIHPVLFAAFPILALYAQNLGQIPIREIYRPLGLALLGMFALWAVFLLVTRHLRKAALAASAVSLVFCSYGHILNLLPMSLRGMVAPGCIAGLLVLLFVLHKTRRSLLDATAVLNLAALVLVAPSCWAIGASLWNTSLPGASPGERVARVLRSDAPPVVKSRRLAPAASAASASLPDVYYIILDAYGRADSLKMFYGYDNSPFLQALEKRGFYIARHSRANYDQTPLCLASALNFTYLDDLSAQVASTGGDIEASRQMLDDNAVAAHLSKLGHHYVYIGSGAGQARVDTADLALNNEPDIPLFEEQALSLTPAKVLAEAEHSRYDQHRNRLLGAFRSLNTVAQLPYPKFVFAHILAPHPPFVLNAQGEAVYPSGTLNFSDGSWLLEKISREEYKSGYIAQLQYINRRVLEAVDAILKQSRRPPIIILQGDHGSRMNLDWESQAKTDLREPFSILNAYYVPQRVRRDLYDTISPVNSFRVLLTDVFGAKYARLPDRSFYSTAYHPFDFAEVTDLLPGAGKPLPSSPKPTVRSEAVHSTEKARNSLGASAQ